MDYYQSDFTLNDLEELAAPFQDHVAVVGEQYCHETAVRYRLENEWMMSKAWTVTDVDGDVVFRVRGGKGGWIKSKMELVDPTGNTVVFLEEKPWTLRNLWKAYKPGDSEPLWTMKTSSFYSVKPSIHIYLPVNVHQKFPDYTIEGQFLARKCRVFCGRELVAEMGREASMKNLLLTKSIFNVTIYPGVDTAFICSLIVIMDKVFDN